MKKAIYFTFIVTAFLYVSCSSDSGGSNETQNTSSIDEENSTTTETTTIVEPSMQLVVNVPQVTPSDEFICVNFNDENDPLHMIQKDDYQWELNITQSMMNSNEYRYCRNCECEAADEEFPDIEIGWRKLTYIEQGTQQDSVQRWRWLSNESLNFQLNEDGYKQTYDTNLSGFMTGIMLIDWFKSSWIDSVDTTMQKIATQTNTTWIQYTPIPEITQLYPIPKIVQNAANGTSDEELIQIIQSAHKHGLKVFLNPSPWSFQEDNSTEEHTQEWWTAFKTAWKPIMLHYADLAQEQNVEMLEFKMWPNIDAINNDEKDKIDQLATDLLTETKDHYNGKIAIQSICYDLDRPILDVHTQSDYLTMNLWSYYPWHLGDTKDDNVTQISQIVQIKLDECKSYYDNYNISKPIIIEQLSAASYDGDIIGANANAEEIDSFHKNNDNYILDLQEQADVYEAIFQNISKNDWIVGNFAFTYFYWDSVGKDINIRAKPAENIVAKWYGWMNK